MTCKFYTRTECGETRTRPRITLFSSQLQGPNVFSDTSEPSWVWAFCAGCWDTWGFCCSPSLLGLNWKAKSLATEKSWCQHCWDLPWIPITHHFQLQKKSGGVGPCCLTTVFRTPFYQNAFLNMARWPVTCGATLHKSITLRDLDVRRQLKVMIRAQVLTGDRIRLRVKLYTDQCVTSGAFLDLSEPQFSLLLNGHPSL